MARVYKSKIGRLPHRVRHALCQRLRDGQSQAEILAWLNGLSETQEMCRSTGSKAVSPVNLTDWTNTGYQDWCADQERTAHLERLTEHSLAVLERTGGDPSAVGARLLAGKLLDVMEELSEPETIPQLVQSIVALRSAETAARKTELTAQANDLKARTLALEEQKFRRQTCELFQAWYDSDAVRALLGNERLDGSAKTEALGQLLFGDLWEASDGRPA